MRLRRKESRCCRVRLRKEWLVFRMDTLIRSFHVFSSPKPTRIRLERDEGSGKKSPRRISLLSRSLRFMERKSRKFPYWFIKLFGAFSINSLFIFREGLGSHFGTFAGKQDYFSSKPREGKPYEHPKPNIKTNPPKKGTGYGLE